MRSRLALVASKDSYAAHPGRWTGCALRHRGLSAARPSTLRVCARGVRATCRPWRREVVVTAPLGMGARLHHGYASPLRGLAPLARVQPRAHAQRGLLRVIGRHVRHASRPPSGAHPTRGRPVCYRALLLRAQPVHRPARAAQPSQQRPPWQPPHATSQPTVLAMPLATVVQQPRSALLAPLTVHQRLSRTRSGQHALRDSKTRHHSIWPVVWRP